MIETGPEGRRHVPSFRKACWKGDPAGCCLLCYLRLLWFVVWHRVKR